MRTARAKEWVSKGWQVVPFALVPFSLKAPALAKSSERVRVSLLVEGYPFVHAKAHVLVKAPGLRMLFVHCEPCDSIAIPYSKASAKSLSPFLRSNEQFPGNFPVSP